jgi:drug/metabolite transporter (DMT)-like permease
MRRMRSTGTLLCVASGIAFGAMAAFGTLAYDEGATVGTLLTIRFAIAASVFWAVLAVRRAPLRIARRDAVLGLALGACGYAAQAGCYFGALQRIDASLLALILYSFPAIVAVAAIALGRERADRRRLAVLVLSSTGLVLVVATAGTGSLDPLGAALAFAAALIYSAYILVSDGISRRLDPAALAALVCTGAGVMLAAGSAVLGDLRPGALSAQGLGWIACLAVVSTVIAIALFFAGLRRVGPTSASILATVEPVVTVGLAVVLFGESLGVVQAIGGVLVLSAVPALALAGREGSRALRVHVGERATPSPAGARSLP